MATDNMAIWNALRTPPANALKQIQAGRLKGKSDINPQWRMEAMTEQFGPIGLGWYYKTTRKWLEPVADGQVAAFVDVEVYVKHGGEWSKPIEGTGGAAFMANERSGLYLNDECFKMATTDALSVAFKALGVAADVYRGAMEGSKYSAPQKPAAAPVSDEDAEKKKLLAKMWKELDKLGDEKPWEDPLKRRVLEETFGTTHIQTIKAKDKGEIYLALKEKFVPAMEAALKQLAHEEGGEVSGDSIPF